MKFLKWRVMFLIRTIFRVSSYIPIAISIGILMLLAFSYYKLGSLPQYGIDNDPHIVFSSEFFMIKNISLIVSLYLLIVSFLTLISLLIIKFNKLYKKEKIFAVAMYALGIIVLVIVRESSSFQWLVD